MSILRYPNGIGEALNLIYPGEQNLCSFFVVLDENIQEEVIIYEDIVWFSTTYPKPSHELLQNKIYDVKKREVLEEKKRECDIYRDSFLFSYLTVLLPDVGENGEHVSFLMTLPIQQKLITSVYGTFDPCWITNEGTLFSATQEHRKIVIDALADRNANQEIDCYKRRRYLDAINISDPIEYINTVENIDVSQIPII